MGGDEPSVCFVAPHAYAYFDPDRGLPTGGAERQLYLLARELRDSFDVRFVVGDFGQPRTEVREGVTLHRAHTPAGDLPAHGRAKQLFRLFSAMRRANADVYVFRGEHARAIVTFGIARLLGARWVYNVALDSQTRLGGAVDDPLGHAFRYVLERADGVIAQTPEQRTHLRESFGVDATVVPNGYPPVDEVRPYEDREFFLYVGRINEEQKRTHRFLDLARAFPDESFVLAGPRDDDEAYCDRVESGCESLENVRFLGRVDPDEIHEYLARAIALVNTSAQEGFPNTFLEAWRAGTPVLSLEVDPGRFLDEASTGHAEGEFDRLERLVAELAESVERRRTLGERSRRGFERTYQLSAVAREYAAALRAALDGRGAERPRDGAPSPTVEGSIPREE